MPLDILISKYELVLFTEFSLHGYLYNSFPLSSFYLWGVVYEEPADFHDLRPSQPPKSSRVLGNSAPPTCATHSPSSHGSHPPHWWTDHPYHPGGLHF